MEKDRVTMAETGASRSHRFYTADELIADLRIHQAELHRQNQELRRTQLDLANARDRYVDLFESAPVGYLTLDPNGIIEELNQTATTLLGTTRIEARTRRMARFIAPDDHDRWYAYLLSIMKGRPAPSSEFLLTPEKGNARWVRISALPTEKPDGRRSVRIAVMDCTDAKRLEEANARALRLRLAVEAIPGGLYDWERGAETLYWSGALDGFLAQSCGECATERADWWRHVPADDRRKALRAFRRAVRRHEPSVSVEYRLRRREAQPYTYVVDRYQILRDACGRVHRLVGTITDISAQKAVELALANLNEALERKVAQRTAEAESRAQALAEAERFLRGTVDSLNSRLCVLNERAEIIATNKAWREAPCHDAEGGNKTRQPVGCSASSFERCCWSAEGRRASKEAIARMLDGKLARWRTEYRCETGGETRWYEMNITRFEGASAARLVVRHDDITERKDDELELGRLADELKTLSEHLHDAREEQNASIARELHDELGASLTMLKLGLSIAADEWVQLVPGDRRFAALLQQVDAALSVTKRISSNLRPATLDTLGLVATIHWYLRQFEQNTAIATSLRLPDYVRLSRSASIAVFRIIQEALTNVAKHAHATQVRVFVVKRAATLIACVSDDGLGFNHADADVPQRFGLMGMRERARQLGGQIAIETGPTGGTRVTLSVPLDSRSTSRAMQQVWE